MDWDEIPVNPFPKLDGLLILLFVWRGLLYLDWSEIDLASRSISTQSAVVLVRWWKPPHKR